MTSGVDGKRSCCAEILAGAGGCAGQLRQFGLRRASDLGPGAATQCLASERATGVGVLFGIVVG